ncbi:FtsX-like permease family protein [Streptosporangium sp. NPDC087985]|uniref:FtsX-like permease family protein n=1 Tax=Streptosporangium sp. NPDC087985 TaxID=3366196 RepID=UPI00380F8684
MITVMRMLAKGGSRRERVRGRLMAAGAALATFLLCVAVNLLAFGLGVSRDPGGFLVETPIEYLGFFSGRDARLLTALALALLVVPAMAFAHQVSRLATATRERRLAALRLAGATPREVRLLGAYESGRQTLLGGLSGIALYLAVNLTLSWSLEGAVPLVPPAQALAILAAVMIGGTLSGLMAGRHVVTSPLGVVRRTRPAGPRALDLVLVAVGAGMLTAGAIGKGKFPGGPYAAALSMTAGMVLLLFGLVLGAAWLIRAAAWRVGDRTEVAETLLAARMIEADPRGWARALSVVGLTVFFGSAVGAQQGPILLRTGLDPSHAVTYLLVDLALLVALVTSAAALVVHQAEDLLDHRRSFAALAASGTPGPALGRVLTRQALIAALPVCIVAAVAGVGVVVSMLADIYGEVPEALAVAAARAALMAGIGVLAAMLVARAARPILRGALRPEELREE